MKNINNYIDLAAYNADSNRPTNQNTVSLVKDINLIFRNEKNIIVDSKYAGIGDTVVYDTVDQRPKVVKLDTLILPLSGRYIVVGTVWRRDEKNVYVVSNQYAESSQWGAPWRAKMSGFDFTVDGSFTITINLITTAAINYTTSDTLATLAVKIQDAIRAIMTTHPAGWTATAYENYIVVQQDSYTPNVTSFTCSYAGVTINVLTGNYQTATTGLLKNDTRLFRIDGSVTSWASCNYEKFLSYHSVNGSDATNETLTSPNVIRESRFNATDNPILFNYYGTYRNYIAAKMIRYPYSKGIITDYDGKGNTDKLASVMFTDHDGALKAAYPAAHTAKNFGIANADRFTPGSWWLPSAPELYLIMKDVTYGLSGFSLDRLNKGIEAADGTKINAGHYIWTSSEHAGNGAFYYCGGLGGIYATYKRGGCNVRPLSAFQIL